MGRRVVVHAGFHKTGTTSVQRCLRANGPHLWPIMALGFKHQLKEALYGTRAYSTWGDTASLTKFRKRFSTYVSGLDLGGKRQLCLSSEELCGHMPGRGDLADYSAAPTLMRTIAEVMVAQYGQDVDLRFYFTTRAPEPWLFSSYWEHVKSSHMILDFDEYRTRYAGASDLAAMIPKIRVAVGDFPVTAQAIEDCGDLRLGPADPLLDLLDIPAWRRNKLEPQRVMNQYRGDAVLQELLAINRRTKTGDEARPLKQAYLAELDAKQ